VKKGRRKEGVLDPSGSLHTANNSRAAKIWDASLSENAKKSCHHDRETKSFFLRVAIMTAKKQVAFFFEKKSCHHDREKAKCHHCCKKGHEAGRFHG